MTHARSSEVVAKGRFLSRVEGNMSRVEVEGKKNVFLCGLYLLGQDSLIFLVFT